MTLVVSQYEKTTTIYYTIKVYSTFPFDLKRIPSDAYKYKQEVTGKWAGKSAGGCGNYKETYPNNPRYQFAVDHECQLLIELKGPKQYQIGFDLVALHHPNNPDKSHPNYFKLKQSGPYRSGYVVLGLEDVRNFVPTIFRPGQESAFFLSVKSSTSIKLLNIQ